MAKCVFLCILIVAVLAYTVLGDTGSTISPLADFIDKWQSISNNLTSAGTEGLKSSINQLTNQATLLLNDLKAKYGENSDLVKSVKKTLGDLTKPLTT